MLVRENFRRRLSLLLSQPGSVAPDERRPSSSVGLSDQIADCSRQEGQLAAASSESVGAKAARSLSRFGAVRRWPSLQSRNVTSPSRSGRNHTRSCRPQFPTVSSFAIRVRRHAYVRGRPAAKLAAEGLALALVARFARQELARPTVVNAPRPEIMDAAEGAVSWPVGLLAMLPPTRKRRKAGAGRKPRPMRRHGSTPSPALSVSGGHVCRCSRTLPRLAGYSCRSRFV